MLGAPSKTKRAFAWRARQKELFFRARQKETKKRAKRDQKEKELGTKEHGSARQNQKELLLGAPSKKELF